MTEPKKPRMRDGLVQRGRTWSYVVREVDPKTGKARPRWVGGFPTQTAAKAARDAARTAVRRGTYVAPQDLTVGQYLDQWMAGHTVTLKPSTARSYVGNIERYLRPRLGNQRLQSLSPSGLSATFKDLSERGGLGGKPLSPRTVEFARAILRRAMQDAVLDRVIEVNPVVGTKGPRVVKPKYSTWTGAQLHQFLGGLGDDRWAALWTVSGLTGMRRGEVLALRWADVDLDAGLISVERAVTQIGEDRTYGTPKNHERRDVPIDPHAIAVLRSWRTQQAAERLKWGAAYKAAEGLLFVWEDGTPVLPDYVSKEFGRAQRGTDLPRLKLHELRHTYATLLLRNGVEVHMVARWLGHKDTSVTQNVYAHAIPDDDGRAVDVLTRVVWGA